MREWPAGGKDLADALRVAIEEHDAIVDKLRHDLNVLIALDIGGRRFGALGEYMAAMDAKFEGLRKEVHDLKTEVADDKAR
jgi:CO/xanthine dehydrogenase FAD-binding subunit